MNQRAPVSSHKLPLLVGGCGAIVALAALAWIPISDRRQRASVAIALTKGDPVQAPALMLRYGCSGCHTIKGVDGADGKVGPPLVDFRSRVYIAGHLRNTSDNLVQWLVAPQSISAGTAMPATGISADEARNVAAFLYAQ